MITVRTSLVFFTSFHAAFSYCRSHVIARRRRETKVRDVATGGSGDGRRAASRHYYESRANVSFAVQAYVISPFLFRRTFPPWDPIAFPWFYFLIIGIQVRIDLRGNPKESTVDRYFEDADPRGLSRLSQQHRMQTGQIPTIWWSLYKFRESNLGSHSVAFREVTAIFSISHRRFFFFGTTRIFFFYLLQIDESSIRRRLIGAKDIHNGSWFTIIPSCITHHASRWRLSWSRRHSYGDCVGTIHGPRLHFDCHAFRYIRFESMSFRYSW